MKGSTVFRRTTVRSLLAAVVTASLLVGTEPTSTAAEGASATREVARAGWKPEPGAIFNVPRSDDPQKMFRLERQVVSAVKRARAGSDIRISIFSFDRMPLVDALKDAHRRGVSVQVLVNDHEVTRAQRKLAQVIGRKRSRSSWIYQCENGCRSSGENLHDKFYLFSRAGAARWTVMSGSINMKLNGHKNQYNDLWTRNDDEPLYRAFEDLFTRLKADRIDRPGYRTWTAGRATIQATPLTKYSATNDPIMDVLGPVKCFGATGTAGKDGRTVVRVMMHAWNGDRGTYIARRIRALHAEGCDVRLLYGFAGEAVRDTLARTTTRGRVPIRSTGYDTNADGELDLYTHQKNLVISGHYGDDTEKKLVVTGSSNWTVDGMRGDEIVVLLDGIGNYGAYNAYFNWLWSSRSRSVRWSPTTGRTYAPQPTGGGLTRRELAVMAPRVEPRLPYGDEPGTGEVG